MIIETIRSLIEGKFSGYIKINFSQGSLGRVERSEELGETITYLGETKGNNKCEEKDSLYDNAIESGNIKEAESRFGQVPRSEQDRRLGNNQYVGYERRCGVERRSCQNRNCKVTNINRKRQSETKNLLKAKKRFATATQRRRDAEKTDAE